ncbi:hypothetical protein CKAN_02125800 [Cinnamomum micranthum f. kanehirae]|uniref:Uncharacterized protein n=1 Tax=Cinnamomum micranthum f. kanehirae TaxID=337451 RepID=A0A3S3PJQ2_9MAGN|nr:hypothetical protein CKAN_02125800 [Cinnamomum micranthum f. kanehirae]
MTHPIRGSKGGPTRDPLCGGPVRCGPYLAHHPASDQRGRNTPALVSRSLPSSREALPVIISSLDLSDEGSPVHANSPTSLPVVISSLYLFRSRELSDDCSPLLPLSSLSQRAVRHLRCDSHLLSSLSPGATPRKKRPSLTKPLSPSFDCARLKSQPR